MASYERSKKIGSGGFGVVYRARRDDGLQCAMKRLTGVDDEECRKRFQREVRLQATLDHPNIMPIIGANLRVSPPWYVMPLASRSLRDEIDRLRGDEDAVLGIFSQMLDGVEHAHTNGVIHRDLKPENILFLTNGRGEERVVISDFGCGRFVERDTATITMTGVPLGSVVYMAPEQWTRASEAAEPADIYALGKILYEMLTGDLSASPPDLQLVPGKLRYIVGQCTQPKPERRYPNIAAIRRDLEVVYSHPERLQSSQERLAELMKQVVVAEEPDESIVAEVNRILLENAQDDTLLMQLARFPQKVVDLMMSQSGDTFASVLRAFDEAVSGSLSFDFTDVVADFYARLFPEIDDHELQGMIIARLNEMGCSHNRWHVGGVLAKLLHSIHEPSLALAARDALREYPLGIRFVSTYVRLSELPAVLREEFEEAERRHRAR